MITFLFSLIFSVQCVLAQKTMDVMPPASTQTSKLNQETAAYKGDLKAFRDYPTIVLIGFWNPTNEMLRRFSPNRNQNPQGWQGHNWRGLGYNVVSFFPEFPEDSSKGVGDFEIDFQDTSQDFWRLIPPIDPVTVLSFGRGAFDKSWEIELMNRNLGNWINDYLTPTVPTPLIPDAALPQGAKRLSAMPIEELHEAINTKIPGIHAFSNTTGAGSFLCEYLGYHLNWYRALHPDRVRFTAHTHVGSLNEIPDLEKAVDVMLEVLISKMKSPAPRPVDMGALEESDVGFDLTRQVTIEPAPPRKH